MRVKLQQTLMESWEGEWGGGDEGAKDMWTEEGDSERWLGHRPQQIKEEMLGARSVNVVLGL